jgi:L-iditol 2-dehydrogenase
MRTIVCRDFNNATITEIPRPVPTSNEVLVEISRVQLSVTECNLFRGKQIAHYETVANRLQSGDGRLFGHEFCGTVIDRGEDVSSLAVNDRVYAPGKIACGKCQYCRSGYDLYCPEKTYIGYDIPGALAEYVALPAEALRTVPSTLSDAEVAALQPLASSVLCVRDADIKFGDTIAVIGTGIMGFQCAQLALITGAKSVIAVDVDAERLAIAANRGLTTIDTTERDPVAAVRELTNDIGADVVFEAVGGQQDHITGGGADPAAQAMQMVARGGTVVQVGYIIGDATVTPRLLRSRSIRWVNPVTGVTSIGPGTDTGDLAANLVAEGRISIEEFITHERPGLDSFDDAVEITLNKHTFGARGPVQLVLGDTSDR